jgi:hypothetical protein
MGQLKPKLYINDKRFPYVEFDDEYNSSCFLEVALYDELTIGVHNTPISHQIFIDRNFAKRLLPFIQNFVDSGALSGHENYPCDTCNGEVVYFEGTWICNSCEKIFQGGEPV